MRRGLSGVFVVGLALGFPVLAAETDPVAVLQKADEAFATGGIAGMVAVFRAAVDAARIGGQPDPELLPIYSLYADATRATGDSDGALAIAEAGLALARAAGSPDPGILAALSASRAYAMIAVRPPAEAIAGLREAVALSDAAYGSVPAEAYLRVELADRLEAEELWHDAVDVRRAVVTVLAAGGEADQRIAAGQALARCLFMAGDTEAAIAAYRELVAEIATALPPDHPDRARALNDLAVALLRAEEALEALPLLEEALRIAAASPPYPEFAAALHTNLAAAWSRTGRPAEARHAAERAVALWSGIGGTAVLSEARALNILVEIELALGRHDRALAASDRAVMLTRGHEADASGTAIEALDARGTVLFALQRFRPAEAIQRRALSMWLALRSGDSAKVIVARQNLAGTLIDLGAHDEARSLLDLADASAGRAFKSDGALRATLLSTRGALLSRLGAFAAGGEAFEAALSIWRKQAPGSALEARELSNLAAARINLGRIGEAEDLLRRSLAIWQAAAPDHPDIDFTFGNLIELLQRQGRLPEALALARRLAAGAEADGGLRDANAKIALALLLRATGKPADAEATLRDALAIRRGQLGDKHASVAEALGQLCLVLWDRRNLRDALACAGESIALRREILPPGHREIGVALNNLAFFEAQAGRTDEASRDYREALGVADTTYGPTHPASTIMAANLGIHLLDREGRPAESLAFLRRAAGNVATAALFEATAAVGSDDLLRQGRGFFTEKVRAIWTVVASRPAAVADGER